MLGGGIIFASIADWASIRSSGLPICPGGRETLIRLTGYNECLGSSAWSLRNERKRSVRSFLCEAPQGPVPGKRGRTLFSRPMLRRLLVPPTKLLIILVKTMHLRSSSLIRSTLIAILSLAGSGVASAQVGRLGAGGGPGAGGTDGAANVGQTGAPAGQVGQPGDALGAIDVGVAVDDIFSNGIDRSVPVGSLTPPIPPGANPNLFPPGGAGGIGGVGGGIGGLGGGIGGLGGGLGAGGLGGFGNQFAPGAAGAGQPAVRVRLRSGIELAPVPPPRVARRLNQQLRRLPVDRRVPGVTVYMDGRTAILTGVVETAKDRRMSELLVKLEPGVSQVDNRLTLVERSPSDAP